MSRSSAYPTNGGFQKNMGVRHQLQYVSDPTLIDSDADRTERFEENGRRSVQDSYSFSHEASSNDREGKRQKKKKMKKFKSFMHVFLGGLKKHQFNQAAWNEDDGSDRGGQYQQKKAPLPMSQGVGPKPLVVQPSNAEIPGLCGLYNHGNTCFMNAILQCLSNTDQLAEYFVTDQYKNDLNRQKSTARTLSSQGDVTEQFAILLKCLWNCQYDPRVTSHFKEVVGKYASQYQGTSQHDAQEFFLWLLDSVHEDLNQASKKKYRPIKDGTGRPDEEVAAETLQSHRKRNNSFIQNLFQGQFRSSVACPSCGTRSATFDPYVCISLPLPQRERRPVYITVVYRSSSKANSVYGVNILIDSTIRDLRNSLAEMCGINRYHLVLADLHSNGFNRTFYDDQHLSAINSGDMIFGFECPPYRGENPEAITQANPSGSKELMLIMVVNKLGQTQFGKRFGPPLILRVWRDLTHSQFQSVVLKALVGYLREGIRLADVCRSGVLFKSKVMDALPGRAVLPTDVDHPFYSPSVDKALHVSMLYGGPAHIKLVAEWDPEIKARVFGVVPDEVPEPHQSVMELQELYRQPLTATLNGCLKIYTKEETLNREDSWFCAHCKCQQQDATKKITLWTLPDVLVVHLKRFRHVGYCRTKLNTLVSFPTQGLDMTPYLAPRSGQRPASATLQRKVQLSTPRSKTFSPHSKSVRFQDTPSRSVSAKESKFRFPWKKRKSEERNTKCVDTALAANVCDSPSSIRSAPSTVGQGASRGKQVYSPVHSYDGGQARSTSPSSSDAENVYDLYAVCNHMGTMTRGHYNAYCRNPADGRWYLFDDNHVQSLSEEQLVTAGAYLLFYVRQSLINQLPPLSSTSSSSSSSGGSGHWAMHIPRFRLDLIGSTGSPYTPNINEAISRSRFGSTASAVSAPPGRGLSPQSSGGHDNESDVFTHSRAVDNHSAVSLPPSYLNTPLHHHQFSSPVHQPSTSNVRFVSNARHASLRVSRPRQFSPENLAHAHTNEQFMRRGTSFHGSRQHQAVQRSLTDSGRVLEMPPHPAYPYSGQSLAMPSRSIPNITAADFPPDTNFHVPSRSIPDMPAHMSPTPQARPTNQNFHFMTPQPHRARTFSAGYNPGAESCV